jgi:chromosome segregation ATPase
MGCRANGGLRLTIPPGDVRSVARPPSAALDLGSRLRHHIEMANDNKKINDLVSENDDDTSELEVLTATVVFDPDHDYESESDAATHSFETSARSSADAESVAALKSDLQRREENINNLQYDMAELRARWTGLEKELKAREELTDNVTRELEESNRKLAQTIGLLKKRDSKITALESTLAQQTGRITEAESSVEQARKDAEMRRAEIASLQERNLAASTMIDALNADLAEEKSKRRSAEDSEHVQIAARELLEGEHAESLSLIATLQQYIEGRKSRWERQEADLRTKGKSLKEQRKENARLAREARVTAERLRKERSARQRLQAEREHLQARLGEAEAQAAALAGSVSAAEDAQRDQQERITGLVRQLEDAAPALELEQAARRKLEEELSEQQQQATVLQSELAALRAAYSAKETSLTEQQENIIELSGRLEEATERLATEEAARRELERQLELLRQEAHQLRAQHGELTREAARKEQLLTEHEQAVSSLSREVESLGAGFSAEQSARQALSAQYDELEQEAAALRAELAPLRAADAKLAALEREHAELTGLISSREDSIRDLTGRLAKTEGYADVLRIKLQQQQADAETMSSGRREAENALAESLGRVRDLSARLETEQQLGAQLRAEREDAEKRLEEEVRRIRFELDAAQETVAGSEALNEQLASELAESSGLRRGLETQLREADEKRDREIRELSKQVAQLRKQIDDYERKISNKDAAINALLTELAHKPASAEDNAAADDVVHRLADRKPHIPDERPPERDRVTRLLIGNIEGQELRFPLFKDKLTIGRTVHNDIQLKAQYVSRRHAVVVTEDDRTRIVDWGSKNGIYVNGKRVSEKALKNGDRVTVGTAEFKFEERPKR